MILWQIQRVRNLDSLYRDAVRHTESSEMWPGQMRRISPPMGCDRITCLPLRWEQPDHKAHCWRVPTHCIPWRPATTTPSGSWCSGMVVKIVIETMRVLQTNNINCTSVFLRWMACAPYVKPGWIASVLSHRDWVRRHACLQLATGRMSILPCLFTHYSKGMLDLSFSSYLHYPIGLPYD